MKILFFLCLAVASFAQTVTRPPVPSTSTLNSPTSQIKAWYLYAVDCEKQIAELSTAATKTFDGIDVIKVTVTALRSELSISWEYVNQGQTGFTVERSTNGTAFETLRTLADPAARGFTDIGLTPGSYWYRVRAYKPTLVSAPSNVGSSVLR
jgi:hypothetical protein